MGGRPHGLELALDRAPARALLARVDVEPEGRFATQWVDATAAREALARRTKPAAIRKRGLGTRRGRGPIAAPREQRSGHEARHQPESYLSAHALPPQQGRQPNCCGRRGGNTDASRRASSPACEIESYAGCRCRAARCRRITREASTWRAR